MSSEIHGKALTKLIALAAILAFALGFSCIGTEQALASDDNPLVDKIEATVDPPVIGQAPASTFVMAMFSGDDQIYGPGERSTTWRTSDGNPLQGNFEKDQKYCFSGEYSTTSSDCPGLVDGALGFVNDKPSKATPPLEPIWHNPTSGLHMMGVNYEWTLHEVSFNSNNGTNETASQTIYEGEESTLDENKFTFAGHVFTGWNTKEDGSGTSYSDKATLPSQTTSITLYAQWAAEITVTFDANEGTGTMDPQKMFSGEAAELAPNAFTRDGYTFKGWNTAKDGSGASYADKASATFQESITLYAQWEAVPVTTHTVTFDANGGTGSMDPLTGDEGSEVALTANAFTCDGYTFKGWNTAKDGSGTAYADKATVKLDSDITLYAQWEAAPAPVETHTVTFDANGGTGSMDPLTGDGGSEVALTANKFTRDNYTFKGWNTKADGSGTAYADKATVKLDGDIILYAQWSKKAAAATTSTTKSNSLANTGDTLPIMPIVLVAGVAAVALLVLVLVRRKVR